MTAAGKGSRRSGASDEVASMSNAIETSGLVKNFGDTRALNGVDLRIHQR
jgi:hypothetical protein